MESDGSIGLIYFTHGASHLARLLVSLHSLRKHYSGPVTILDTGESGGIIEKIAADERLRVEVQRIEFVQRRRNSAYCMKSSLWRHSPYSATVFLDADTVVVRSIQPLLDIVADTKNSGFVVTRFGDWVTTGPIIQKRIERWRGIKVRSEPEKFEKSIDVEKLIKLSLESGHPAINTGVIGWRDDTRKILGQWERLTHAGYRTPFTDELGAQLIIRQERHTLIDDRWNFSPLYGQQKEKAAIYHCHGSKHVLRGDGRGDKGHAIWWPLFREVWEENVGRVREWVPAGDQNLARHLPVA